MFEEPVVVSKYAPDVRGQLARAAVVLIVIQLLLVAGIMWLAEVLR